MKPMLIVATCMFLASCMTTSGTYTVAAYDPATGNAFPGPLIIAEGRSIYTARNALCIAHANATVVISDLGTGQELKSESPYKCR